MADRVGAVLRAAREKRALDLGEVAARTRIPTRHLAAIEDGAYEGLPAATYSAGFVKTYARLLGLDGQALSHQFRSELAETKPVSVRRETYEPADPARTPGRGLAWGALAVAVLIILGFLYWHGSRLAENPRALAAGDPEEIASPVAARAPPPRPVASTAPLAPTVSDATTITAESAAWIKIYERGGATLFMGVLDPGKSFSVPATASDPLLQTARPNALKVTVGNSAIPVLGAPERLIKDVSLKPAALLARLSPASGTAVPPPPGAVTPGEGDVAR